eukprot:6492772-Amphidinium_carterae.2
MATHAMAATETAGPHKAIPYLDEAQRRVDGEDRSPATQVLATQAMAATETAGPDKAIPYLES